MAEEVVDTRASVAPETVKGDVPTEAEPATDTIKVVEPTAEEVAAAIEFAQAKQKVEQSYGTYMLIRWTDGYDLDGVTLEVSKAYAQEPPRTLMIATVEKLLRELHAFELHDINAMVDLNQLRQLQNAQAVARTMAGQGLNRAERRRLEKR